MTKFPTEKVLDLGFLGTNWQGAQLVLSGLTFAQTRELAKVSVDETEADAEQKSQDFVVKFLNDHFVRGKAWNGTTLVELTKEDLTDLPVEVITKSFEILNGTPDPKS